jgi:ADP-ribosylglycohydrolase
MTKIFSCRERILGTFLGKSIGGTLGQPWEGCSGPLSLNYYDPVPTGM